MEKEKNILLDSEMLTAYDTSEKSEKIVKKSQFRSFVPNFNVF